MRGCAIGVEHAEVGVRGGEVQRADGGPQIRKFQALAQCRRKMILERLNGFEHAMHEGPQRARGYLAGPFVDRDDAAGVERGVAIGIVGGEDFELRMHDQQVAGVAVELHFAVQRHARAGQEAIHQIAAVKPFGEQPLLRRILENGFEQSEIAPAESAQVSGLHLGDHGRHFAGRELRDGLHVGAILVAERARRRADPPR